MTRRLFVYVSGPISKGDMFVNVRTAILAAEELRRAGLFPYVPHLSCTWQMIAPVEYEAWMELDFAWITRCDVILRQPGESSGADREVAFADDLEKPCFYSVEEVIDWARSCGYLEGGRPAGAGRRLLGTRCGAPGCGLPQYATEGGDVCDNGHGGAPPLPLCRKTIGESAGTYTLTCVRPQGHEGDCGHVDG